METKSIGMTLGGVAAGLMLAAPAVAAVDRVSATEKGSLVWFSKIELRWGGAAPYDLLQDTFLTLTNDGTSEVKVKFFLVNGDDPLPADPVTGEPAAPGWNKLNNGITLTPQQTFCWSAALGDPAGIGSFITLDPAGPTGPGRPADDGSGERMLRGFIVAWAVNAQGEEIRHNHLFGNGLIVNYAGRYAWEYNSWNHAVVSGVAEGQPSDGTPGQLLMNGAEYSPGFDRLRFNFYSSGSDILSDGLQIVNELDVTMHPEDLDVRQEGDGPVTTKLDYLVWNENETPFSQMHRCITCWDQQVGDLYTVPNPAWADDPQQLGIPNNFLQTTLQTDCGYARVEGVNSQLCDIDFDPANNDTFPFPPGPGDPIDPRDVVSQDTAILGVIARLLTIDGGVSAASGYNAVGTGTQSATILYDPAGGDDEGVEADSFKLPGTASDIQDWLERKAGITTSKR